LDHISAPLRLKKTPFRDEPTRTIQIEWRIGGRFYQKKKRKAMIIYLYPLNPFTKSAVEIYNTLNVKKPMELTIGLLFYIVN